MKKLFSFEVKEKAARFLASEKIDDLEKLGFDINQLLLMALHPPYYTFEVRKKSGGFRRIEAPEDKLKRIQRLFSFYLQCVYFTIQSKAAYGYIIRVKDSKRYKNILENARQHHGAKYMLNVDFEDFFHQITFKQILSLLQKTPFQFDKKSAHILCKIFTRQGRLPMGAPTSPVLSNIACLPFDDVLLQWAAERGMVYTRFVDDLTFSSKTMVIGLPLLEEVKTICKDHQLKLNPAKTKFYLEQTTKKVTGLVLNETIDIDPEFYKELDKDLKRLRHMAEVHLMMNKHNRDETLRLFKKEVEGQINFIGTIEGYDSQLFFNYRQKLKNAFRPKEDSFSVRWTNANYF